MRQDVWLALQCLIERSGMIHSMPATVLQYKVPARPLHLVSTRQ